MPRESLGGSEWLLSSCLATVCVLCGCSRAYYRQQADQQVYEIIDQNRTDPRWQLPDRPVEPGPRSRMADPADPDQSPLPPDDPAAHRYMHEAYKLKGSSHWHDRGDLPQIEDLAWLDELPRTPEGKILLSPETAIELALSHSRQYQDQVETVYLTALFLTLERFEFDIQWFAGNDTFFDHFGSGGVPTETNTLSTDTFFGFQRAFATGGQLIVDFANSFVWEFTGKDLSSASSSALVTLTQPLLRGAFRQVRLESLTQAERNVLYAVRGFSRFRRDFYVQIMNDFLGLLFQVQGIRNIEANLASLERNLREHEELAAAGVVSAIQVDQVFQSVQQTRLGLVTAQAELQRSLDNFKITLGLPPHLEVHLDASLLATFELSDPRLDELGQRAEALYLALLQPDEPPPREKLAESFATLLEQQNELMKVLREVAAELDRWKNRLDAQAHRDAESSAKQIDEGPEVAGPDAESRMQHRLHSALKKYLQAVGIALEEDLRDTKAALEKLSETPLSDAWASLQDLIGDRFRARVADTFVIQTQIRTFLVELAPVELKEQEAIALALDNRLDLMNQQGRVVDAWRKLEVAADALEADLDVRFEADLGTDPDRNNPVAFSSSNSRYSLGLEFDSPLTRRVERNAYRASQIAYQQARRAYMAAEDQIQSQIRDDLRNLNTNRLQFEITRQQLLAAVRQVEESQFNVRNAQEADSSVTQDLLGALQTLLNAKNSLINNWVNYEVSRMSLFRDLDLMQIDSQGVWTNEHEQPGSR